MEMGILKKLEFRGTDVTWEKVWRPEENLMSVFSQVLSTLMRETFKVREKSSVPTSPNSLAVYGALGKNLQINVSLFVGNVILG